MKTRKKKDMIKNKIDVFVTNGDHGHSLRTRDKLDYYATDPAAVYALLKVEKFNSNIFECAVGGGHIAEVLIKNNYKVFSSDIVNRGYKNQNATIDFFKYETIWNGDIITNPPYKYAVEFVEKSLKIVKENAKIAMFLKLTFLEGEKRRKLFEENPPLKIYVFRKRINCAKNGNEKEFNGPGAVCYAWFIWQKGNKNKPIIDWI